MSWEKRNKIKCQTIASWNGWWNISDKLKWPNLWSWAGKPWGAAEDKFFKSKGFWAVDSDHRPGLVPLVTREGAFPSTNPSAPAPGPVERLPVHVNGKSCFQKELRAQESGPVEWEWQGNHSWGWLQEKKPESCHEVRSAVTAYDFVPKSHFLEDSDGTRQLIDVDEGRKIIS